MNKLSALITLTLALPIAAQGMPEMPKPTKEHQKLAVRAGSWDASIESMGPTGSMEKSKGKSVAKVAYGGFWLVEDFKAEFMGMKFQGQGMTGYDPVKGKYVGTWVDSMSPYLMTLEGNFDDTGKILTMTGMGMGMDGKMAKHRLVTHEKNANHAVMEMFVTGPDGKEMKAMTINYTRGKAAEASSKRDG